ncbi:MAG: glycoside hydrolase family 27 protein [Clostridia bacterium]|nr:glycoside hydrolase family 27 protein [Clostridia bacterium]
MEKFDLMPVPPMGFNTWYYYTDRFDEELIFRVADKLVDTGLRDLGYRYIQIDYGWCVNEKDYPTRDENGDLLPDPHKFPHGMKYVADYIHGKGLKIGYYTDIGVRGVGNEEGSYGRYLQDVKRFASWDADLIKVDAGGGCVDYPDYECAYRAFAGAVEQVNRTLERKIAFHVCCAGDFGSVNWGTDLGHYCRTSRDVSASIPTVNWDTTDFNLMLTFDHNNRRPDKCGPNGFNDMDVLMLTGGLSETENISYFTIFCMEASPLMLALDLPNVDGKTLEIISNREAIAVNQDPLGIQATLRYEDAPGLQVWAKPLANGDFAVMLLNRTAGEADITLRTDKLGMGKALVRDLWEHRDLGVYEELTGDVESHGTKMFRIFR